MEVDHICPDMTVREMDELTFCPDDEERSERLRTVGRE